MYFLIYAISTYVLVYVLTWQIRPETYSRCGVKKVESSVAHYLSGFPTSELLTPREKFENNPLMLMGKVENGFRKRLTVGARMETFRHAKDSEPEKALRLLVLYPE